MSTLKKAQNWLYQSGVFGGLIVFLVALAGIWLPWWTVNSIEDEEGNFQILENDRAIVTLRWKVVDQWSDDLRSVETALREKGRFAPTGDYVLGRYIDKKKIQIRILPSAERLKDHRQRPYAYEVIEASGSERFTRFFSDVEEVVTYILQDGNWQRPEHDIQRVPHPYPPYHQWVPKPFGVET